MYTLISTLDTLESTYIIDSPSCPCAVSTSANVFLYYVLLYNVTAARSEYSSVYSHFIFSLCDVYCRGESRRADEDERFERKVVLCYHTNAHFTYLYFLCFVVGAVADHVQILRESGPYCILEEVEPGVRRCEDVRNNAHRILV